MDDDATVGSGLRLLVVDDEPISREIVASICGSLGFDAVEVAENGADALEMVRASRFGMVLSDWNMAPVTGFELLEAIRADDGLSGTAFVMMTARRDQQSVIDAKYAGVDSYILKPFTRAALAEKLRKTRRRKPAAAGRG